MSLDDSRRLVADPLSRWLSQDSTGETSPSARPWFGREVAPHVTDVHRVDFMTLGTS